jgi:hypothetical protein
VGVAHQVRLADRVISLTDTGNVRKRDSLLRAAGRVDTSISPKSEKGDYSHESADSGARPLSTVEAVQGIVVGATLTDDDDTQAPAKDPAAYRYYIGGGGKRKFLIFLGTISIFVVANMVSRALNTPFTLALHPGQ